MASSDLIISSVAGRLTFQHLNLIIQLQQNYLQTYKILTCQITELLMKEWFGMHQKRARLDWIFMAYLKPQAPSYFFISLYSF